MTDQLTFDPELLQGSFVQIPTALLRRPDVSSNAVRLYGLLLSYAIDKAVVWPGQDTLCTQMGLSDKPLRVAIRELEALGLVTMKRSGDGKTARYHVQKMGMRPTKENKKEGSEAVKTPVLKKSRSGQNSGSEKEQKRSFSGSRSGVSPVVIKEEVDKVELDKAATQAPLQKMHDSPVNASFAAADNSNKEQTRQTRGTKPSKPEPVPLPGPDVSLLDYDQADIERLRKTNPAELVRRFREQNPIFADRMAKKAATAHTSPNPLLARCIVEDWLPEIRVLQAAPALPPPRPYRPPVSTVPAAFRARYEADRAARLAALDAQAETGRSVH